MKTLILNGSPHPNGDTAKLLHRLVEQLEGEYRIYNAYTAKLSPCMDCRACRKQDGCVIQDEMQEIYAYLTECDHILIASPVYFSELTGKLLDLASRLQRYFNARVYLGKEPLSKPKRGAILLVGGGMGKMEKAVNTATILLHQMQCQTILPPVISAHTDCVPAIEDPVACEGIRQIAAFFHAAQDSLG